MKSDALTVIATKELELRKRRTQHLPSVLFGEHAWDLLLVLFLANAAGERLETDEACRRAGGPLDVVRRWLSVLESFSLVAYHWRFDEHVVALTPEGLHAVEACMLDARSAMQL